MKLPLSRRIFIKRAFFALIFIAIAGYVYFGFNRYLSGPEITVRGPLSTSITFTEPFLIVEGAAKNVAYLYLNDRQIYTDPEGTFREEMLLERGYNRVRFSARDSFGRSIQQEYRVVLIEEKKDPSLLQTKISDDITSTSSATSSEDSEIID